jgi:hypothetical protein
MKISRIALLAGLGMLAMTLPAAATPTASASTDVRTANPDLMQVAQAVNRTRQINEERGGLYKSKKAKKKKAKKKM